MDNSLTAKFSSTTFFHYTPIWVLDIVHKLISDREHAIVDLASDEVANLLINADWYYSQGFPGREVVVDQPTNAFLNPYGGVENGKSNAMLQWEAVMELWLDDVIDSAVFLAFNLNQIAMGGGYGMKFFPTVELPKRLRFIRCQFDYENWGKLYTPGWKRAVKNKSFTGDLKSYTHMKHEGLIEKTTKKSFYTPTWNEDLEVYLNRETDTSSAFAIRHKREKLWFFTQDSPPHHSALVYLPSKKNWNVDNEDRFLTAMIDAGLDDSINVNLRHLPDFTKTIAENIRTQG